jgi:hypothetical protein
MKLGTVAQNTTVTFRLPYCPESLLIVSAGVPVKVQVRILGEGVSKDLDATGLLIEKQIRRNKDVANYYQLTLADGLLKDTNIEIDVTAHATNAAEVHEFSTGKSGYGIVRTERTTVLANTSQTFADFFGIGLSAVNANDQITIEYKNGVTQVLNSADEVKALSAENNQDVLYIDNFDGDITSVKVMPTQQITIYKISYKSK